MPKYPIRLTLPPEERNRLTGGAATTTTTRSRPGARSRLIKSHTCTVTYPDGCTGTCRYTRGGPAWHLFKYEHQGRDGETTSLPVQYLTQRLENSGAGLQATMQQTAVRAFDAAIERERKEYFCRASECPAVGRVAHRERSQMKAKRARALAGKYALCQYVGKRLLPLGDTFDTLLEANESWQEVGDRRLVVACCNRLDRCWEMPRFNSLYGDPGYDDSCHGDSPCRACQPRPEHGDRLPEHVDGEQVSKERDEVGEVDHVD